MKAAKNRPHRRKTLISALIAFQSFAFLPQAQAAAAQTVGQIEELKSTGPGTFLLTLVKGTEKNSVIIDESTLIRVAVKVESLEAGDTIWPVPGSQPLSEEESQAPPAQKEDTSRPGVPPAPPQPPLAVPPPPEPPKQPPQPPETPKMPQPPEVPQPPKLPPMPGQQQAEQPSPEETPQAGQQDEAADGKQAPQKKETKPEVETPDPDSLSPEDNPLTAAEAGIPQAEPQAESPVAEKSSTGANKVLGTTEVPKGIRIKIEDEEGQSEEQVYPLGTPLLRRSPATALVKGMIAHIELVETDPSVFVAQSITAASKESLKAP